VISSRKYPIPSPTIMFIKPGHLTSIVSGIISEAKKSWFLQPFAWRHKLAGVTDGFITNQSLWDRLVFDGARARVIGDSAATLRAVVVSGGMSTFLSSAGSTADWRILGNLDAAHLTSARIALSVPFVNVFTHPLVAAPVLASHAFDLQDFYSTTKDTVAPTGPPGVNVEAKLVSVDDDTVEKGGDPSGDLLVRGPPVGKMMTLEDYVDVPSGDSYEWAGMDVRARIRPNGAFLLY
jgi:long-chain acyl-CoA synthetase